MIRKGDLLGQGVAVGTLRPCGRIIVLPVPLFSLIISTAPPRLVSATSFLVVCAFLCSEVRESQTAAGDASAIIRHTQSEQMEQHGASGRLPCWWSE